MKIEELQKYYRDHQESILEDYFTFLKFQSISSEPKYQSEVLACASWLEKQLKEIGLDVERWEPPGHPVLLASWLKADPTKPTLLLYSHYDVQPVDPIEEWHSPPFTPTIREGQVFARGAQDNKGQCFYVLQALKYLLKQQSSLPINLKWCIEGEEETGSTSLSKLLKDKQEQLRADYLAIVDVELQEPNTPAVTLGVRGIVTMDMKVEGSPTDLHSGTHGGIVYNPLHALVEILAKLRDSSGKVTIPGFYDDVASLTPEDKKFLHLQFDPEKYEASFGKPTGGEKAFSPLERAWLRPTLEINGLSGGYSGTGFKTVIPAKASAKISCRLVPNQEPQKVGTLVKNFLEKNAPDGTAVHVSIHTGSGPAARSSPSSPVVQAFAKAYSEVFQSPCQFIFGGGSIPIAAELAQTSGSELVLIGLGLPDDHIHAPNEHFGLDRLEKGFLTIIKAIEALASRP